MTLKARLLLLLVLISLAGLASYLAAAGRADEVPPPRARLVEAPAGEERGKVMSVIKVLELVGSSSAGWQDAVRSAVQEARRRVPDIVGVEVTNWTANVTGDDISEYKANVKIAYSEGYRGSDRGVF